MRYIDFEDHNPPEDWVTRANLITKRLELCSSNERSSIVEANASLWTELKDFLSNISYKKCWYSESKDSASHNHVDHFRPKLKVIESNREELEGYWWLAFDWTNYRYCCGAPNIRKNAKFSVKRNRATTISDPIIDEVIYLIDPTNIDDVGLLSFGQDGRVGSVCKEKDSWDFERVKYSIATLNLNFESLVEARMEKWSSCTKLIDQIDRLTLENSKQPSAGRKEKVKALMKELKALTRPDSEFSVTATWCLRSSGKEWALGLLQSA